MDTELIEDRPKIEEVEMDEIDYVDNNKGESKSNLKIKSLLISDLNYDVVVKGKKFFFFIF